MAWVTPTTFVSGNALTAAQLNILSADLNETAPGKFTASGQLFVSTGANAGAVRTPAGAAVSTNETTASNTYVDLATIGPSVTVTTGTSAIVIVSADMGTNTALSFVQTSYAVSGGVAFAADNTRAAAFRAAAVNQTMNASLLVYHIGLGAGSNTFKQQYQTSSGGGTASFQTRRLTVIPL